MVTAGVTMGAIRVSHLPSAITEETLWRVFSRCGEIERIKLFANQYVERFAIIVFFTETAEHQAKRLDGLKLGDCYIKVE
jgi:hypothetical protein